MTYRALPKLKHWPGAVIDSQVSDALSFVCQISSKLITEIEAVTFEGYLQANISGDERVFAYKDSQGDTIVEISQIERVLVFTLAKDVTWSIKCMYTALIAGSNTEHSDIEKPDICRRSNSSFIKRTPE